MTQVTILTTVYNGLPYLEKAIESMLTQTLTDFKFVIVDDGSTDGTAEYLAKLDDSRVTIVTQSNQGTAAAANYGLSFVETPFVARMDADDLSMPNRLQRQLEFLQAHPEVGIVGAQVAPIGEKSVGKSLQLPRSHDEIFANLKAGKHALAHSVLMMRTDVLKGIGGYWKFRLVDDWDMMLRMGEVSRLANMDDIFLHYRVHSGSLNGQSMKNMHQQIGYAVERSNHRDAGTDPPTFEEFVERLANRPIWSRISDNMHIYALANYRLAIAEIHGGHKVKGLARLAWSACCSPTRTMERISRIVRGKLSKPLTTKTAL